MGLVLFLLLLLLFKTRQQIGSCRNVNLNIHRKHLNTIFLKELTFRIVTEENEKKSVYFNGLTDN